MAIYALGDKSPILPPEGEYWIAPDAQVIGNVKLARGVSIWFGVVIRGDNELITIGENSNIQDGSVLHSDEGSPLTIGANVTVGHKVMVHGCTIGDGSLIGIGSIILNRAKIGKHCLVGAQALVTEGKEFPDFSMILGAPAKVAKTLGEDYAAVLQGSADNYMRNRDLFSKQLRKIG